MRFTLAALTALALASASAQAQNLLSNGNLDVTYAEVIVDNAPAGPGVEDFYLPKPLDWLNVGSRTIGGLYEDEMSSEPWAGPAPTPVTADGAVNGPHPQGCGGNDCAVFFKPFSGGATTGAATAHLYQDVPGTPGMTYTLTGWAGAEASVLMADAELAIDFLNAGGGVIGSAELSMLATLNVPNGEPFAYKQYSISAVAPASTALVRARVSMIDGLGNPAGGGQAFVVDDFELTVVPEPASAIVAVTGLGVLAAIRRRRG